MGKVIVIILCTFIVMTKSLYAFAQNDIHNEAKQTALQLISHNKTTPKQIELTEHAILVDLIFQDKFVEFYSEIENTPKHNHLKFLSECLKLPAIDKNAQCYRDINNTKIINWRDRHNVLLALTILHLRKNDYASGLQYASKTLSNIPYENSSEINNASYEAYYLLHIAYLFDYDISGMLDAIKKSIKYSQNTGRRFNVYNVIYNTAKLFSDIENGDTAVDIAKTAIPLPEDAITQDVFVTHYAIGNFLLKQGSYAEAEKHLDIATKLKLPPYNRTVGLTALAEANAFSGRIEAAKENVNIIKKLMTEEQLTESFIGTQIDLIQSKIHQSEGNYKTAHTYLERYTNSKIKGLSGTLSQSRIEINKRIKREQQESELALQAYKEKEKAQQFKRRVTYIALMLLIVVMIFTLSAAKHYARLVEILKKNKVELEKSSKYKDRLLSMFSHEMMTPLNGILPLIQLLRIKNYDERTNKLMKTINGSANELHEKLQNILISSQKEKLQPRNQSIILKDIINEMFLKVSQKYDLKLINATAEKNKVDCTYIMTDKNMLLKVLYEMIDNALKFSNNEIVDITFITNSTDLQITISDKNTGVTADSIERHTSRMEQADAGLTRSHDGMGLGIHASKQYINTLNGRLEHKNNRHNGIDAIIRLHSCIVNKSKIAA